MFFSNSPKVYTYRINCTAAAPAGDSSLFTRGRIKALTSAVATLHPLQYTTEHYSVDRFVPYYLRKTRLYRDGEKFSTERKREDEEDGTDAETKSGNSEPTRTETYEDRLKRAQDTAFADIYDKYFSEMPDPDSFDSRDSQVSVIEAWMVEVYKRVKQELDKTMGGPLHTSCSLELP